MPFSDNEANQIIDAWTSKTASYTAPAAFYVGLSQTTPTNNGGNVTEPSGGAYARISVAAGEWDSAASQQAVTNTLKEFVTATADWVSGDNLTHMVFWDHLTNAASTNFLGFAALTVSKPVLDNDTAKILAGNLIAKTT